MKESQSARVQAIVNIGEGCNYALTKEALLADFHRVYLQALTDTTGGNVTQAAKLAGMDRSNFRRILKRYPLVKADG